MFSEAISSIWSCCRPSSAWSAAASSGSASRTDAVKKGSGAAAGVAGRKAIEKLDVARKRQGYRWSTGRGSSAPDLLSFLPYLGQSPPASYHRSGAWQPLAHPPESQGFVLAES